MRGYERKMAEVYDLLYSFIIHLFFNLKSQPLDVMLPHVLHLNSRWTKWSIV